METLPGVRVGATVAAMRRRRNQGKPGVINDEQQKRGQLESQERNRRLRELRANPPVIDWDAAWDRLLAYMATIYDEDKENA